MGGVIKSNLSPIPPNPLCYYSFIMILKIVHSYHSDSQQNELFQTLTKEAVSTDPIIDSMTCTSTSPLLW